MGESRQKELDSFSGFAASLGEKSPGADAHGNEKKKKNRADKNPLDFGKSQGRTEFLPPYSFNRLMGPLALAPRHLAGFQGASMLKKITKTAVAEEKNKKPGNRLLAETMGVQAGR